MSQHAWSLGTAVAESNQMHLPVSGWQHLPIKSRRCGDLPSVKSLLIDPSADSAFVFSASRLPVVTRSISSSASWMQQPLTQQLLMHIHLLVDAGGNARKTCRAGWRRPTKRSMDRLLPSRHSLNLRLLPRPSLPCPISEHSLAHCRNWLATESISIGSSAYRTSITSILKTAKSAKSSWVSARSWLMSFCRLQNRPWKQFGRETSEIGIGPWFVRAFRLSPCGR